MAEPTHEDMKLGTKIASRHPVICWSCGGPLPNPECAHRKNGKWPVCIPLTENIAKAIAQAIADERERCAKSIDAHYSAELIMRDQCRKAGDANMSLCHSDRAQMCTELATAIRNQGSE